VKVVGLYCMEAGPNEWAYTVHKVTTITISVSECTMAANFGMYIYEFASCDVFCFFHVDIMSFCVDIENNILMKICVNCLRCSGQSNLIALFGLVLIVYVLSKVSVHRVLLPIICFDLTRERCEREYYMFLGGEIREIKLVSTHTPIHVNYSLVLEVCILANLWETPLSLRYSK
jgi:hypothetical protein